MKTSFNLNEYNYNDPSVINQKINSRQLDELLEMVGDSRFVLLGEATHGTHEFYTTRMEISKRLIQEKGFSFIAVEGDWPDCYKINRFIKGYENAGKKIADVLMEFERWPTWMWANWEIAALAEWLKEYNLNTPMADKKGFYGLDVYSLWESMEVMNKYLEKEDPETAEFVKSAVRCFEPFKEQGEQYGWAARKVSGRCRNEVLKLLMEVRNNMDHYDKDPEAPLNAEQNAYVALNAEKYYRQMISFGAESWNTRDLHMADTLDRLINFHGKDAKAIIWEHNTHIGDARYTDMTEAGYLNIGQVVREKYTEKNVVLVGFGSYKGTVMAGAAWGAPMAIMQVPDAIPESVEHLLHSESSEDRIILFKGKKKESRFSNILHRAIGVVYNPLQDPFSNYVPTTLDSRYDAFIYLDETTALHPIYKKSQGVEMETYPSGM